MAAGITFSGLATGIDSAGIISQLMSYERRPISRLQSKQKAYDSQASKLKSLSTKLKALQDAAKDLGDRDDVLTAKVSSSDEDVFTARSVGGAPVGPTSLHVTSLATNEKTYSDAFSAKDQTGLFGTGTLSIQVGAATAVDVTIAADDTLDSVVGKINASGAGVSAGVVFDGTNYRLRVTGDDTGAASGITFTETGVTLGMSDPANQIQAAADAVFTLDGFAMTRSANTFSDAIDGVSITLTGESPTVDPSTLMVERDPEALEEKFQTFVDAYNDIMTNINAEFAYTGTAKGPGSLAGDSTLRSVQSQLRSTLGAAVSGMSGQYTTLASVGIESNQDGTLKLDSAKLTAALDDDANSVATLFAGDTVAGIDGFVTSFDDVIDVYIASGGVIDGRVDALEGRSRDIDDQIDRLELRLDKTEESLRKRYATLEQTVSGLQAQGDQMMAALLSLG